MFNIAFHINNFKPCGINFELLCEVGVQLLSLFNGQPISHTVYWNRHSFPARLGCQPYESGWGSVLTLHVGFYRFVGLHCTKTTLS